MSGRRGIVLAVVLIVIGMLAVTMAGFMFMVRAEISGMRAQRDTQQARLAAESGLEELSLLLRTAADDTSAWYDDSDRFRHVLVWADGYTRVDDPVRKMGSRKEIIAGAVPVPAWRYSIVAPQFDGLRDTMRYGITPEAGKLNLNAATETEIERLITPILLELQFDNVSDLIESLLDWLDADEDERPNGAESRYYNELTPGYMAKNGPLDTLEELLLIRHWSPVALYGEDVNRNGILDPNEDDGDLSFPYHDNADGVLNAGVAPFVTVWSSEPRVTGEGQQRQTQVVRGLVNVNTAPLRVLQALDGMSTEAAESILALRSQLAGEALAAPDWVLTSGAVDQVTYDAIRTKITTRALQFHVEVVGYGDHTRVARRLEWVIEMHGSLMQVLYHRDLTALGLAWPVDDDTLLMRGQSAQ